jgi:predicted MPP superfamily phosphohydrolase/uncharacterized membrane protein
LNFSFLLLRLLIGLSILTLLFLSQRFWYQALWRVTSNWRSPRARVLVRLVYIVALVLIIATAADGFRMGHGRIIPRGSMVAVFTGLWFSSALFAFLAVKLVKVLDRVWTGLTRSFRRNKSLEVQRLMPSSCDAQTETIESLRDPSRRYFFRTASAAAGAAPFLGVMYGFASERLNYQVRRVDIAIPNLPSGLNGLNILHLSDIHMSSYMSAKDLRRAVDMANQLGADIAVVTGDFITGASDPLADCVEGLRRLEVPLGIWGCNGNHEIYARAQDSAQYLFESAGMKLLRQESTQISHKGAAFNLIGVDYQRERDSDGYRHQVLVGVDLLVRRDMPNILLSHNPNTFNRAAELGIELSLAGHTHGGQVQVEILDHRLSPARFITDYVAGLYRRPLLAPATTPYAASNSTANQTGAEIRGRAPIMSHIYVNRGLGTVGAPVRLGVPPEISLITLRRA